MKQYDITGMSCAACSARVDKAVSKLDGVSECNVNLLTNSMTVEGSVDPKVVIDAVESAGYGASLKGVDKVIDNTKKDNSKKEYKKLIVRLVSSVVFLCMLMYVSMGYMMFNLPLPYFFSSNPVAIGLIQMLLAGIIIVINQKFYISGFKGLINRSPNMDTLVSMGSFAAFAYSTVVLFMMTGAQSYEVANHLLHELYFESSAMVLTLITIGKLLESKAKGKTTDALKSLMNLAPNNAIILVNGIQKTVPVEQVKLNDVFIVKPGQSIPVDGVVIKGSTAVDESALTGESLPADKEIGDIVNAGTINQTGYIECSATRVGENTTLSQIIQVVNDAAASKAPIAKIADKVSGVFVPIVLTISLVTLIVWLLTGATFGYSLARAISVLVISCPCALGLATPVAIMVGSGVGAKNGILFKTATALETTGKAKIVALDKTGTITQGKPKVTDVYSIGVSDNDLLELAYSIENKSEHPLAKAVVDYSKQNNISYSEVNTFETLTGNGVKAIINDDIILGGNISLLKNNDVDVTTDIVDRASAYADEGKTPLFFAKNNKIVGIIAVADVVKEDSKQAVNALKNMGVKVVMLTGDNEKTAKSIGDYVGVDEVISGVLPTQKDKQVIELQKQGKVIMVGDGINDAPALTRADVGIAVGSGTDIAIDSADVVIMKSSLMDVVAAIKLSRGVMKNIHQNLGWAFGYNVIGIPLAAGAFIPLFGWALNPLFGAAAMSISSFLVVTNALRLNFIKLNDNKKLKSQNNVENIYDKENDKMIKTIKIEGMMCPHCSGRVKQTLEAMPEVIKAQVSHETGEAIVELNTDVDDIVFKNAIENDVYKFISVQ